MRSLTINLKVPIGGKNNSQSYWMSVPSSVINPTDGRIRGEYIHRAPFQSVETISGYYYLLSPLAPVPTYSCISTENGGGSEKYGKKFTCIAFFVML